MRRRRGGWTGTCPLICVGVTCDDGKTYCNSCLAAGAGHCVITG